MPHVTSSCPPRRERRCRSGRAARFVERSFRPEQPKGAARRDSRCTRDGETKILKDPEETKKNKPSQNEQKRNNNKNQAKQTTRSGGLNSSARTLIYYD